MFFQRSLRVKNSSHPHPTVSASQGFCRLAEVGKVGVTLASLAALWKTESSFLPQGLCTGCSLCLEYASLRHALSLPASVSAPMSLSQRGLPQPFFYVRSLSHLPSFAFLHETLTNTCYHSIYVILLLWVFPIDCPSPPLGGYELVFVFLSIVSPAPKTKPGTLYILWKY